MRNRIVKTFSISHFITIFKSTFKFMPIPSIISILITISFLLMVEGGLRSSTEKIVRDIVITLGLGFFYFLNLRLYSFVKNISKKIEIILSAVLTILLLIFYLKLPDDYIYRYIMRISILLVIPVIFLFTGGVGRKNDNNSYAISVLYIQKILAESLLHLLILFGGIASILWSLDLLFDIDIKSEIFLDILIILSYFYFPFFFMNGVKNFYKEEIIEGYFIIGRPINILFRYIVIPLLYIYIIILYIYFIKVIFLWDWPIGITSYLITIYSFIGLFSTVFSGLREKDYGKSPLDRFYSKHFFLMILPLLAVFYLAIFKRINDYGFTENRYLLLALALWITFISIVNIIKKNKAFYTIPLSLAIVSLLTIIGPWNMFNISKNSQLNRFKDFAKKYNLISETSGKLIPSNMEISFEDRKSISSILTYLNSSYRLEPLKELLPDSLYDGGKKYKDIHKITEYLGFTYVDRHQSEILLGNYKSFTVEESYSRNLNGGKKLYSFNLRSHENFRKNRFENYTVQLDSSLNSIELLKDDSVKIFTHTLKKILDRTYKINNSYDIPQEIMCDTIKTRDRRYLLLLKSLNYKYNSYKKRYKVSSVFGLLIEEE